jgi:hypothetical protein
MSINRSFSDPFSPNLFFSFHVQSPSLFSEKRNEGGRETEPRKKDYKEVYYLFRFHLRCELLTMASAAGSYRRQTSLIPHFYLIFNT